MTANRVQTPTNLKERIAAFQQRYGTPTQFQPVPSPTGSPTLNPSPGSHLTGLHSAGLRDKIAKFEQKGGVPVPRGSFGLGAPPVAENGLSKRRGELYGNRIPGVVRASAGGAPSRSGSPLPPSPGGSCSASASGYYDGPAGADLSPTLSAFPSSLSYNLPSSPPSPESPKVYAPTPRRSSFAAALSAARRSASASDVIGRYDLREASASPPSIATPLSLAFSEDEPRVVSPTLDDIVVLSLEEDTDVLSPTEILVPASDVADVVERPIVNEQTTLTPLGISIQSPVEEGSSDAPLVDEVFAQTEEQAAVTPSPPPATDEAPPPEAVVPVLEIKVESFGDPYSELSPLTINENLLVVEESTLPNSLVIVTPETPASADLLSPESVFDYYQYLGVDVVAEPEPEASDIVPETPPIDPLVVTAPSIEIPPKSPDKLSLSSGALKEETMDVVETLENTLSEEGELQTVAIENPSPSPSPLSEHHPKIADTGSSVVNEIGREDDVETRDLWVKVDDPPPAQDILKSPQGVLSPYSISDYFAPTPVSDASLASPNFSIDVESPPFSPSSSYIVSSPPLLSSGPDFSDMPHVTFVRAPNAGNRSVSMIETSDLKVTSSTRAAAPDNTASTSPEGEFGTVSMHGHMRSYSHSQKAPSSFSAVVHRKVTVTPSASSSSPLDKTYPETTQSARGRRTNKTEMSTSPAFGDLAVLLEEAALLEQRLLEGDVPGEENENGHLRSSPEPMTRLKPGVNQERMKLGVRAKSSTEVSPERDKPGFHRSSTSLSIHASPLRSKSRQRSLERPKPPPTGALPSIPLPATDLTERMGQSAEVQYAIRRGSLDEHPPKSPFPRYIANLRRLASSGSRSSKIMPGAYPRHSASTSSEISSEDSVPMYTPSDHNFEFGGVDHNVLPGVGTGLGVGAWPSGSPKKNGSLTRVSSRASSFAEKLWNNRKRTKSTASSTDTSVDSIGDEPTPRQLTPIVTLPPALPQDTIPPLRSSSLIPDTNPPPRSSSWVSGVTSTSTIPSSPIFDNDIVDAFPSVPQDAPGHLSVNRPVMPPPNVASSPPMDSQATTPTDVKFNVHLSPSNTMPLRPRMNSIKKVIT